MGKLGWACLLILAFSSGTFPAMNAYGSMEWKVVQQLRLAEKPRAVAASFNGDYLYILVEGKLIVYSLMEHKHRYSFSVDKSIDMMTLAAADLLVLTSSAENVVRVIQLEFPAQLDTSGLPYRGADNAPVNIVVFIDYQCPHCGELLPFLQHLLDKYENKLRLVFKFFPPGPQQIGFIAATAALSANEQKSFWRYHEMLFTKAGSLDENKLYAIARDLRLDLAKFKADMRRSDIQDLVRRDVKEGMALGISGTPAIFINGRRTEGLNSADLQKLIESEINMPAEEEKKK